MKFDRFTYRRRAILSNCLLLYIRRLPDNDFVFQLEALAQGLTDDFSIKNSTVDEKSKIGHVLSNKYVRPRNNRMEIYADSGRVARVVPGDSR